MNKWDIYKSVALRPVEATKMLWNHKRTLGYLAKERKFKNLYNHIFTIYFIRGEDCGKGILDPVWKLTGKAPFLWDLEMETTTACYLRCIHCEHTYWKDKDNLNQHLTLEALKKVLDSCPNLKWINLTGEGTSILNPEFGSMVHEVKSRGIYLDFSHDFVKLPNGTARNWVTDNVDRIYWSVDGCSKETYESIRVGADFDKVKENVKYLLEWKKMLRSPLPEVCFRFTFFNRNLHEVEDIPRMLWRLCDGNVKLYGDEPSINIVALLEFEETRDWAVEIPQDVVDRTTKCAEAMGFKVYWSHVTHIEEEKAPMDYCTFWSEPYIMITGHVVPCCGVMMSNDRENLERLSFGNINDQSLKEIWNSDYYRKFRRMVVSPRKPVPEVCAGCRAFNTETRIKKYGVWKKS